MASHYNPYHVRKLIALIRLKRTNRHTGTLRSSDYREMQESGVILSKRTLSRLFGAKVNLQERFDDSTWEFLSCYLNEEWSWDSFRENNAPPEQFQLVAFHKLATIQQNKIEKALESELGHLRTFQEYLNSYIHDSKLLPPTLFNSEEYIEYKRLIGDDLAKTMGTDFTVEANKELLGKDKVRRKFDFYITHNKKRSIQHLPIYVQCLCLNDGQKVNASHVDDFTGACNATGMGKRIIYSNQSFGDDAYNAMQNREGGLVYLHPERGQYIKLRMKGSKDTNLPLMFALINKDIARPNGSEELRMKVLSNHFGSEDQSLANRVILSRRSFIEYLQEPLSSKDE